jgi:hypothetical protein
VADTQQLQKAVLEEMDSTFANPRSGGKSASVQFNPETLKVSYANQLAQSSGGGAGGGESGGSKSAPAGSQSGGASRQYVGAGTTKLALQLWFDVTGPDGGDLADVTKLTDKVSYFMNPQKLGDNGELLPPNVRFRWGAFKFDGTFDSLEESFEFFSGDGRPLRAQISFTMSQQRIVPGFTSEGAPSLGRQAGTRPLAQAPAGATLAGLAGAQSGGGGWQQIAAANNIEDPLRLAPGQLVDLNLRTPAPRF